MADYGVGDHGMGYDESIGDGAAQHVPGFSLDGDHASWPGDVCYDQNIHGSDAMDQDSDTRDLWKSHHNGAYYRTAADEEQPSHLQVPRTAGFQRHMDQHAIPLDTDAIVNHYDTPCKHK